VTSAIRIHPRFEMALHSSGRFPGDLWKNYLWSFLYTTIWKQM